MKFFALALALGLSTPVLAQKPRIRFIGQTQNGDSVQSRVNTIAQDQSGFIWLGTETGIQRFDGSKYTAFRHEENNPRSIPAGHVKKLLVDGSNRLWVGMTGSGLCRFFERSNRFQAYALGPNEEKGFLYVEDMVEDDQGYLWVGTRGGLVRFSPDQPDDLKHFSFGPPDMDETGIRCLEFDRKGVLWIGYGSHLYRLDPGATQPTEALLKGINVIKNINEDSNGRLWLSTDSGILVISADTREVLSVFNDAQNPGFPNAVSDTCEDGAGRIWASTYLKGMVLIEDALSPHFYTYTETADDPWGLGTRSIWSIFRDRDDNIWFATNQGVRWLPAVGTRTSHYTTSPSNPEQGLNDSVVWCFFQDRDGAIWVGTDRGISRWLEQQGRFEAFLPSPSHPEDYSLNRVRAIHQDQKGVFFVATREKILRFTPAQGFYDEVLTAEGNSADSMRAILQDKVGELWFGSFHEGLMRYDPEIGRLRVFQTETTGAQFGFPEVRCLLEDSDGKIWIGMQSGMGMLSKDRKSGSILGSIQGRDLVVMSLMEDHRGMIWASTNHGLIRSPHQEEASSRNIVRYGMQQGLEAFILYGILEDDAAKLWISTETGLICYDPEQQKALTFHQFHGLQGEDYSSGAYLKDRSGRMFFGGQDGFNVFYPKLMSKSTHVPPVVLTQIYLGHKAIESGDLDENGQAIHHLKSLDLSQQDKVLAFDFAALDYSFPSKNSYAYKLEGFDNDWVAAPPQTRKATYTNLDPGSYRFRVKAANSLGFWNEDGAQLNIEVAAMPWLSVQAKLAYLICSLSLILLIGYLRSRKIMKERLHWQALDAKNKEIIRAQSQLVMQEKMASVGLLTAGIAHEIKNPTTFTRLSAQNLTADLAEFRAWLLEMAGDDAPSFAPALDERMTVLHEHLELIREGSGRIVNLAQNLQTFSRADNALQEINLTEGITSTLNLVRSKFKDFVTFNMNFNDKLPTLCRPGQMNQVFMNLIFNACQELRQCFDRNGARGHLTIETERVGNLGVIRFKDSGNGMEKEVLEHIFEPFYTTKSSNEGTGLGLAITARIIKEHGGRIEVESTVGIGTTFTLYIPDGTTPDDTSFSKTVP